MLTAVLQGHFSFFSEARRMRIFDLASDLGLFNIYKWVYILNSSGGKDILFISTIFNSLSNDRGKGAKTGIGVNMGTPP